MRRALCFVSTAVIMGVTTLPWSDYTGHAHWNQVRWIPFSERTLVASDSVLNVVLFVPFGFFLMMSLSGGQSSKNVFATLVLAASLSLAAEYFQVYCHNRVPSATDVCTNVLGAGIGILFRWWSATSAPEPTTVSGESSSPARKS
ncbi:MAG: VanZ family protein [Acidobacteria bacterium]|nr:VanZ family protein [Acidobacteriota bacterium]MCI0624626.1 VanZ family protein [Acidobacteriota bacterium]MCI0717607.1 VanZ family protein [Acidobacteriota bacterium]